MAGNQQAQQQLNMAGSSEQVRQLEVVRQQLSSCQNQLHSTREELQTRTTERDTAETGLQYARSQLHLEQAYLVRAERTIRDNQLAQMRSDGEPEAQLRQQKHESGPARPVRQVPHMMAS